MQRRILFGWLLCCLALSPAMSQNRQVSLESARDDIEITDSRVDDSGNVISVGYEYNHAMGFYVRDPVAVKTSRAGKTLWVQRLSMSAGQNALAACVRIAANGDYLIGGSYSRWPLIWRLTPSGTTIYARYFGISGGTTNETISLGELPNGHVALCGNHDFTGTTYINQGYLIHLDSAGSPRNLQGNGPGYAVHTYGEDDHGVGTPETTINDVIGFGKHIYFVGTHRQPLYGGGIVIRTDTNGNNPVFFVANSVHTRGITAPMISFTGARAKNGRLYLAGTYADTSGYLGYLIGQLDTQAKTLAGVELFMPARNLYNPRFEIADTNTWYYAFQPYTPAAIYNFFPHTIFAGKISNGSLAQNRRIFEDSVTRLSAVTVIGDTVICSGTAQLGSKRAGFFCSYNMAAAASLLCNVSDTPIQASTCSLSLTTTFLPDGSWTHSPVFNSSVSSPCVYDVQRCGPPCTGQILHSSITRLTPNALCPGDTLRLVKNGPCIRTTWYRDVTKLGSGDTLVVIADSAAMARGAYYVVTDDGACSDTSNKIAVRLFPVPRIMRRGDTLFSTPGLSWQWIDSSGLPISGATGAILANLSTSGNYYVEVTDSNGCTRRSAPHFYQSGLGIVIGGTSPGKISVYPNPVSKTFSIRHATGVISKLYLTDLSGRTVASWERPGPIVSVAGYQLPPGTYVLTVVGSGFTEHAHLVVNTP